MRNEAKPALRANPCSACPLPGGGAEVRDGLKAANKVIEQANVPLKPTGPSRKVIALLALVMAAFLSIMLAFIFEYFFGFGF